MNLSNLTFQHKVWLENHEKGSQIDLRSVTLDAEEIQNAFLEAAIFDHVNFEGLEILNCDLTATHLFNCTLKKCKFVHCSFHKAEFHDCRCEHVEFKECSFTKTEWYRGDFVQAEFTACDFSWSCLQSVDLRYAQLKKINLEGALWDKTKVYNACIERVNFGGLHLATIQRTDVSQAGDETALVTQQEFRKLFGV